MNTINKAIGLSQKKFTQQEDKEALGDLYDVQIGMILDFEFMEAYPGAYETQYSITTEEKEDWKKIRREQLEKSKATILNNLQY